MRTVISIAVILLAFTSIVNGQQIETNFVEEYSWHGFSLYDNSYAHFGAAADVLGNSVSTMSHADDLEADDFEYWDTAVSRDIPLVDGLRTNAGYGYIKLPNGMDVQEFSGTLALPGNISPRYTFTHVIPDNSYEGQFHTLGLDMYFGDDPNGITARLSGDISYNQGVNPMGNTFIRDWTHSTVSLTVSIPMEQFVIQPSVIWQHNMEDIVGSEEDPVWYGIGVIRSF